MTKRIIALFIMSMLVFGCQTSQATNEKTVLLPIASVSAPAHQQTLHQIGIRSNSDGRSEFFNRETGEAYIPRGYNYTHVMPLAEPCSVTDFTYHSTFNKGVYDSAEAEAMLSALQEAQYNVVRIFLNPECMTKLDGDLRPAYFANLADFLRLAQTYSQYVIVTLDMIPSTRYGEPIQKEEDIWWHNAQYLYADEIALEKTFWQDFIAALRSQNATLETILAYELRNEFYFHPEFPPLTDVEGKVTIANGQTYDMSLSADKERMVEESFVFWSSQIRDAIRESAPTALVTVGFFAPEPFGTPSRTAIFDSELDFVDLHMYPQADVVQADYVDYFGLNEQPNKLLVMGEYGVVEGDETLDEAADKLQKWQRESCQQNISGWLIWTWTTKEGAELSIPDDNTLFNAMSPVTRPDQCG